jgi:uncharacterized surface protein with fasciclin (FAS1) repeats
MDNYETKNMKILPHLPLVTPLVALVALFTSSAEANSKSHKDIVTVASSAGEFKTLVTAIKAAGLVETLKGPGPFTLFAPTDSAFAKLPKGTVPNPFRPGRKS